MNEVGGVDASSGSYDFDAQKRDEDDEVARLRSHEAALGEAYKRDPGDVATMGALVRVQQQLRKREEDASRLAAKDAPSQSPSQSADEQTRGYGIRLPVAREASAAIRLDTPVSHLSSRAEVQGEMDAITRTVGFAALAGPAFVANVDPKLFTRLHDLQARMAQLDAAPKTPAAAPHVDLAHVHAPPEAHAGNAPQIAEMHVELTAVLHPTTFSSSLEVMTYANQYIDYTAKHPELRELHDHAVASFEGLVDEAKQRDQRRAEAEVMLNDRVARMQLRAPLGMEQMLGVGALGLLTAKTVHEIAGLVPVAGEVQAGLEALSGHGMWGIGEEKIEGLDRLSAGVFALSGIAAFAREILNGAEAEQTVARIASESGKSEEEIRGVLKGAVAIDNDKARVKAALDKAKAGETISAAEQASIDRVRVTLAGKEGILSGDLVRAARGEAPRALVENPTGSWGGPGVWVQKTESMRPSAAAFQERVTGVRAGGHTYRVDGVEFDGVRVDAGGRATLLEAKDHYAQFLGPDGAPKPFVNWGDAMLDKVKNQARKAEHLGLPLEVHCSEREVATRLRSDLKDFHGVKIIFGGEEQ